MRNSGTIVKSSVAGLIVALAWLALLSVPFVDWPQFTNYLALISFPAVMVSRVTNPNEVSGRTVVLMFVLLPLLNALFYGFLAFGISRLMERFRKARP